MPVLRRKSKPVPHLPHKPHRLVDGSLLRNDQPLHVAACRPQPERPHEGLFALFVAQARSVDFVEKAQTCPCHAVLRCSRFCYESYPNLSP